MNMTVKYEATLIVSDVLQITIDGENDVNLQDLHQEQMQKCSKHADFIGLECVLVSIKATVVWYLNRTDKTIWGRKPLAGYAAAARRRDNNAETIYHF